MHKTLTFFAAIALAITASFSTGFLNAHTALASDTTPPTLTYLSFSKDEIDTTIAPTLS